MNDVTSEEPVSALEPTPTYELTVNGTTRVVTDAWLGESLLDVLRDRLELPGSKNACEQGECGSCSVLLDGDLVCSCMVLGAAAAGSDVVTVEGYTGPDGELSTVQQAFLDHGAVQCGFCTPGLIVAIEHLLDTHPEPAAITDLEVREAISGNLCRCTGYGRILAATHEAAVTIGGRR